ncbi:MAG: hypothetical protein MUF54_14795, partial [Polyangiaceae bacterium]|nr:hypothetical protein [Polyangiaceae bacterium]
MSEQMLLGTTLVMTSADQRSVLETIRDRSQISMLQFSDIFTALTLPNPAAGVLVDPSTAALRSWVAANAPSRWLMAGPKDVLPQWNDDFADAVRLHVESTEALSKLLARSASARHPLPGRNTDPPRDDWTAGGWRQRLVALLHGGDPLSASGPGYVGCPASLCRWPDATEIAGVSPASWSPRAARALQLMRQGDALELVIQPKPGKSEYTGPEDIDINASAKWMYAKLEAAERQAACEVLQDPDTGECVTVDPSAIPVPALGASDDSIGYRVHARYDLLPSEVQTMVKGLQEMMYSTRAAGKFHLAGNTVTSTNSMGANVLKIDASAVILTQSQEEVAAKFSKFGWHRLPTTIAGAREVAPFYTGDPLIGSNANAPVKSQVLEGARLLGAMPALATVREAVQRAPAGQVTRGESILSTINAAIGASQACVRPVELPIPGSVQTVDHKEAGAINGQRTHLWSVRVVRDTSDPFWSGSISSYSLIAARNSPWVLESLAGQGYQRSGFSNLKVSLHQTFGNSFVERPFQAADPLGWTAQVPIVDGASEVLFVRRRNSATGDSYRMLSGNLSPQIVEGVYATGALTHEPPFDGQCVAVGGRFGGYGSRALAVNSAEPSRPAMDAFEVIRGKQSLPSLSEQITQNEFNNSASLSAYVEQWMSIASRSSLEATNLVKESVAALAANLTAQVDVGLARKQAFNEASVAVQQLCGAELPNTGGGNLGQYDLSAVAETCNLEFVTINAAGSTEAELRALCGNDYVSGSPVQFSWTGAACANAPTPAAATANCNGDELSAEELRECTQKQCEAETQVTKPPSVEGQVMCTLDSLSAQLKLTVQVAKPVACYQYSASIPTTLGGALAGGMQAQLHALRTYRDNLAVFVASGQAALSQGKVADEAYNASVADYCLTKASVAVAMREARDKLAELHRQWEMAAKVLIDAIDRAVNLGAADAEQGKAILCGVAQGAMAGAAGGVAGAVVGGLVGGAVALFGSGPSEEEKRAARQAVEQAILAEEQARKRVEEYTAFLGECDPNTAPDPEQLKELTELLGEAPKCEQPRPNDTLMGLGQRRDAAAWQSTQVARAQAVFAMHDGVSQLRRNATEVGAAAGTVISASFGLRQAAHETALTIAVARMEAELVAERTDAQFAIFQSFHANDMWTAHAYVEAARHDLITARRAVEFAHGIDLSEVEADYGTVKSPKKWVDRMYDYDLTSLPVVLGSGQPPSTNTIDTNKVSSYQANLAAFIQNYATLVLLVPERQRVRSARGVVFSHERHVEQAAQPDFEPTSAFGSRPRVCAMKIPRFARAAVGCLFAACAGATFAVPAHGQTDPQGVSAQAIAIPKGQGSMEGMGESFSNQLSSGTLNYSVPISLPRARGAAQPSLALGYSSAAGSGRAGMGWDLSAPFIARQTDRGVPRYRDPAAG